MPTGISLIAFLGLTAWLFALFVAQQSEATRHDRDHVCQSDISKEIKSVLADLPETISWGILAQGDRFVNGRRSTDTIYSLQAEKFFIPASNTKVLTSAAALMKFGPEKTFDMKVYSRNVDDDDVDRTQICIVPVGFPSLQYQDLRKLAKQLWGLNNEIDIAIDVGHLMGEHSESSTVPDNSWLVDDILTDEGPPPVATVVSHNVIKVAVQPGKSEGDPLTAILVAKDGDEKSPIWPFDRIQCIPGECTTIAKDSQEKEHVKVYRPMSAGNDLFIRGKLRIGSTPHTFSLSILSPEKHLISVLNYYVRSHERLDSDDFPSFATCNHADTSERWQPFSSICSEPLHQIMNNTLQWSNNLEADMWLKLLGVGDSRDDSTSSVQERGVNEVRNLLVKVLGVDPSTFRQRDGSGVSRLNFISPKAMVQTFYGIMHNMDDRFFALYRSMLPSSGISGTLKNRFLKHKGLVQAKTGTLPAVSALSGYVHNDAFQDGLIVFSILVNNFENSQTEIREAVDKIAILFSAVNPNC